MSETCGLFRSESLAPVYTQERCSITEFLNTEQSADVSIAQCRVVPGETTQLHSLQIAERYLIQHGHGVMELGSSDTFEVTVGDCVLIPPGCPQRIRNTGDEDLVFLCVCTPRFLPGHYRVLEDEQTQALTTP